MSVLRKAALLQFALLATLINQVAAQYYPYRPTFCTYNVCYSRWSGWYCCSGYWYGSGWAIALYVFFGLIILICLIWCCVAVAAEPTRTVYVKPRTEIVTIDNEPSTQPAPVTGTVGDSKQVNGGSYTISAEDAPVQGQPLPPQPEPTGPPAQGTVYPDVLPPPQSGVQMV